MNRHAASLLNNEAASVILKGQYISCHSTVHNNRKQICGLLVPGGSTACISNDYNNSAPHIKIYRQLEKWRRSDRFFPLEVCADIAGSMSSWSTCFLCSNVSFCILCFSAAEFTLGHPGWCTVKEKGCFQSLNQLWHKRVMQFTSFEWIVTLVYLMWEEWWQGSSHAKWKLSWVCMTDLQGRPLILEVLGWYMCRLTGRRSSSSILWDSGEELDL